MKQLILMTLLVLFFSSLPNTYYVSPSGLDFNPGTESQPFRTIQKAASVVAAGDTVIVKDGVYIDPDGDHIVVKINRAGTAGNPIIFRSENKYGAKIDGENNLSRTGFDLGTGSAFIRIEGFEIYGIGNAVANAGASGIAINNGGSDSEIVGNYIHDIGRRCTDTVNGLNGIFVQQPRVRIEKNLIGNIGRFAPGENGCNPSTNNYQNHDHGIYVNGSILSGIPGADNTTVLNNIFFNHARGWAIQIYPGTLSNLLIAHNTFSGANPYRNGQITTGSATVENSIFANNIFYQPQNAAISTTGSTFVNVSLLNNLTTAPVMTSTNVPATQSGNQLNTNPLFVDPPDYHLQSNSPAIDAGIFSEVTDDFDGNPRDTMPDIGALEFIGVRAMPTPTPTPSPDPTPTPTPLPACVSGQIVGNPAECVCAGHVVGNSKRCKL